MKQPNNVFNQPVIGFNGVSPKELELEKYIDYKKQFDKTVLDPINIILKVIEWSAEEKISVESFFE